MFVLTYMSILPPKNSACMHACDPLEKQEQMFVNIHTYIHTHMYIHTHTRTYIHTSMHACKQTLSSVDFVSSFLLIIELVKIMHFEPRSKKLRGDRDGI
jgi:hypothetical protein